MNITVFGGSLPKVGDVPYGEAYLLGKLLAQSGHTVMTGGYIGTMEAVSRGANESGGHVIGVTCLEIETWRRVKPNTWVKEEQRCKTLQERLNKLIYACDAAIALPGGPGTLTEITLMWNLMIINALPIKPLILIGGGWKSVLDALFNSFNTYILENQRDLLWYAPDVTSAVSFLSDM
jgi:uncharacterized protein (TIGR00725 family)